VSILTLFAGLGRMYAWATPDRLLDMPISQLQAYYRAGLEHERVQATVLVNRIADLFVVMFGGTLPEDTAPAPEARSPKTVQDDGPDMAAIEHLMQRHNRGER